MSSVLKIEFSSKFSSENFQFGRLCEEEGKPQVWTICFFFDIGIKLLMSKEVSASLHLAF